MKKKSLFVIFVLSIFIFQGLFSGDLSHTRKMRIAKTQFFDIIYSDESLYTANLIWDNADELYQKAFDLIHAKKSFRIPVVISPDSDVLEIKYSPSPYNRIIIYEAVPGEDLSCFEDTILGLFYHEVLKAVSVSVRYKYVETIKNFVGTDSFQPVSLLSLPFSFAEGFSFINEGNGDDYGRFNDGYFLQLLSEAKLEGKFPTWMQASVNRSVYPGRDYSLAAGTAFIAYLQTRFGMEKFYDFWTECSKLHLIRFTSSIIYKVYGVSISQLWKDFKNAVPLPDNLEELETLESYTENIFEKDTEGLYQDVVSTKYGLVWYDDIRHEVDLYELNGKSKIRRLLFLASDVNRIAVSPDGRFLSVSFLQVGTREKFKYEVTWIYDLQTHGFLQDSFNLRDGNIIQLYDGTYGIAGIDVKEKYSRLKIFRCGDINRLLNVKSDDPDVEADKTELIYTRTFDYNIVVSSPVYAGKGKIAAVVNNSNDWSILLIDLEDGSENNYWITDKEDEFIKIRELHILDEEKSLYSFNYVPHNSNAFTRMGYITFTDDFQFSKVFLQSQDMKGGIHSPTLHDDDLYYAAYESEYNKLRLIPFTVLPFEEGNIIEDDELIPEYYEREIVIHDTVKYNPANYWFHGTFIPMMPVRELSLFDGPKMWPGLGVTYLTNSDPLLNTDMTLSGAGGFAKLNFEFFTNPNQGNFSNLLKGINDFDDDWAFSIFVKNTSTPVDISAGTMFNFDPRVGSYTGQLVTVTAWNIPMGMKFRSLRMDIQSRIRISTDYYDSNQIEKYPSFKNWPSPDMAHKDLYIQSNVTYSNIHQYGRSPFEKRGLSISTFLTGIWDLNQSNERVQKMKEERIQNGEDPAVLNSALSNIFLYMASVDLFNFGFSAEFDVPRLTPIRMYKGLVLSVPASLQLDLFKDIGTALKAKAEILLVGMEINQGVPFLLTYFSRAGIKLGYTAAFEYDTKVVKNPSFIDVSTFSTAFTNSTYNDYISLILKLDMIPVIGKFSETEFQSTFEFDFYVKQPGFKFGFYMDFKY